jgi:hypothetical protein
MSSLGDAKSSLGDAKSSLGDAKSSLGDAMSSLGDAMSSLGDGESSLGDAYISLGDVQAEPLLQPSKLNAAGAVGGSTNAVTRRSFSAELSHAATSNDPILRAVAHRVAHFSGTTVEQQEPLQVRAVLA